MIELCCDVEARIDQADLAQLFALLGILHALAARCSTRLLRLRDPTSTLAKVTHDRELRVRDAVREYPVSRAWLYEHGERLGLVRRLPSTRKVVVIEANLRAYLETGVGHGGTSGPVPPRRNVVGVSQRRRQAVPVVHRDSGRDRK